MIRIRKIGIFFAAFLIFSCATTPYEYVEETYPDGKPKTVRYYKDENKAELLREILYYDNGNKRMEGSFKNDERTGMWSYWYPDGSIWSEGVYKDGEEHGLKTVYYENGQKYYEGTMIDGVRTGKWLFWDREGNLIKEINYDKDQSDQEHK